MWHWERGYDGTTETVKTYLYVSSLQGRCHRGGEGGWSRRAEVDLANLDIVAVMYVADIHSRLVVLLRLQA